MRHFILITAFAAAVCTARAQLAITETMSSASTNLGPAQVTAGPDFWELSNFGTDPIDLTGYIFNDADATRGGDADATTLSGVTIAPGESIILVQTGVPAVQTRDDFINWWGATNLPANLHIESSYGGSGGVAIVGGSHTAMTLLAPKTSVVISGGSFFGNVAGGTVRLTGGIAFHDDQR